ncbi:hypothetical protein [Microbacterium sp. B35-30]|uniref:hypothetical protein n=1 Tax=Microbacterium sp. B35-30 TaxID=1962642 RepID=UPI0013D4512C|nr:hypothetical protein [Microbacterium sp. B35-30]KAF2415469.1 hypothetical protein B2K11_19975 [Microbacterium sp. B35-30]
MTTQWDVDADVLYIVSPSYVIHMDGNEVLYDAMLVVRTWDELIEKDYQVPQLEIDTADVAVRRDAARQPRRRRRAATNRIRQVCTSDLEPFEMQGLRHLTPLTALTAIPQTLRNAARPARAQRVPLTLAARFGSSKARGCTRAQPTAHGAPGLRARPSGSGP